MSDGLKPYKDTVDDFELVKQRQNSHLHALVSSGSALRFPLLVKLELKISSAHHGITKMLELESGSGILFHLAPLILGFGIAVYYTAPFEPVLGVLLMTCMVSTILALRQKAHGKLWLLLCAIALFFGGMSAAKYRTDQVQSHPFSHRITGQVSGTIIEVSQNQRGSPRYLIRPHHIEDVALNKLPEYVRLSAASKHKVGSPGDVIRGLARLQAISGPAFPGSFDFSFNSWYNGLGASGFFMGKPTVYFGPNQQKLSLWHRTQIEINAVRQTIAKRIRTSLPGESGDVAVALIVGDRTGISRATQNSLRGSGLAHVLAISGMHMALVSLTMVWAIRFLLAFNMRLGLTHPIKNWAAMAGFFTASSYLAISGMGVATLRAWIMISVMMLAAIVSRKSLTLRAVALAALIILIIQPESVLSPGFQMSFAAVAAIVGAYEYLDDQRKFDTSRLRSNFFLRFFGTLIFTSLIAGLATALFSAYHFHKVAPLGVLTNLAAMPLVSAIIMPMGMVSVLAMPYGLEQYALKLMGAGINQVIEVSDYVNTLGSSGVTGQLGGPVLPLAFIGLFALTMLRSRLRVLGIVVLAVSVLFWRGPNVADILLSEDGGAIAIKNADGELVMLYPRRNKFVRDIWLRAFSNDKQGKLATKPTCSKDLCIATTPQGAVVYVVFDPKLLRNACEHADILLAPKLRWVNCGKRKPSLIIKRGQLEEFGSHAIYLKIIAEPSELTEARLNAHGELTRKTINPERTANRKALVETDQENSITSDIPDQDNAKTKNAKRKSVARAKGKKSLSGVNEDQPLTTKPSNQAQSPKTNFQIIAVKTAIQNTNRPWNSHRAGRAIYRQD